MVGWWFIIVLLFNAEHSWDGNVYQWILTVTYKSTENPASKKHDKLNTKQ